jgi:integrase
MTQAKKRWSYSTGERGRNRVRVFEHPATQGLYLEVYDTGRRKRIALGHRDRELAKAKAEEVAAALRRGDPPVRDELALQMLFDNYLREVTPRKSLSSQQKDRQAARLFPEHFGAERKVVTLSRRDWDAFIQRRRQGSDGRVGKVRGKPVRDRVITQNLKTISAVLNWATMAGDGQGGYLLERNPFKGLPFPKEASPRRPMLSDEQYQAILRASGEISPHFELALILAHETGHRIGSIRLLRWSDVDWEKNAIRWRGENDKIGFEHVTPLTLTGKEALSRARKVQGAIGDSWVFPAPENPSLAVSRHLVRDWWERGEKLAEIHHEPGLGWHSLRRKFATELKHTPLKDLCYLGGWKEPQTVLKCYQRPDESTMREALEGRKPLKAFGG